jgi:hypothetical protein
MKQASGIRTIFSTSRPASVSPVTRMRRYPFDGSAPAAAAMREAGTDHLAGPGDEPVEQVAAAGGEGGANALPADPIVMAEPAGVVHNTRATGGTDGPGQ